MTRRSELPDREALSGRRAGALELSSRLPGAFAPTKAGGRSRPDRYPPQPHGAGARRGDEAGPVVWGRLRFAEGGDGAAGMPVGTGRRPSAWRRGAPWGSVGKTAGEARSAARVGEPAQVAMGSTDP